MGLIETLVFVGAAIVLSYLVFLVLKNAIKMIIHTLVSLAGLYLLNYYGIIAITTNTILVAAIGGIPGLIIMVGLKFLGIEIG